MRCYVFLSTGIYTEVEILNRHVKGQLFVPYMKLNALEVCSALHVRSTCKCYSVFANAELLFFALSSLASVNFTAVQRKPGESMRIVQFIPNMFISQRLIIVSVGQWPIL